MEFGVGDVMQQGIAITAPSPRDSDLGLLKRAALTQAAAAAAPYPSPFLDEQKMLRFSKAAHTLPSGLDFGGPSEQAFLLTKRPFTPSQWMELEHQALIYKYLNAKAPIPSSRMRVAPVALREGNSPSPAPWDIASGATYAGVRAVDASRTFCLQRKGSVAAAAKRLGIGIDFPAPGLVSLRGHGRRNRFTVVRRRHGVHTGMATRDGGNGNAAVGWPRGRRMKTAFGARGKRSAVPCSSRSQDRAEPDLHL